MPRAPKIRPGNRCAVSAALLLLVGHAAPSMAQGEPHQDPRELEALARSAAAAQFPPLSERQRFLAGPLERPDLAPCQGPVHAAPTTAHHMSDRITIELKCPDLRGWHLFVPVRIVGTSTVAVAAHALVVGAVIKESDLAVQTRDVSELPLGFIDQPSVAAGLTVARPIAGGAYLTNQQLVASRMVQRGQSVTLVADAGGVSVRSAGRALSDALLNQRVKVTNLSSGRVVEGIARSEQLVEIILP